MGVTDSLEPNAQGFTTEPSPESSSLFPLIMPFHSHTLSCVPLGETLRKEESLVLHAKNRSARKTDLWKRGGLSGASADDFRLYFNEMSGLRPWSWNDKEQAINCPNYRAQVSLNLCTDNLLVILWMLPQHKHSDCSPLHVELLSSSHRGVSWPIMLSPAHLEQAPYLPAKPPASAGARGMGDSSSAAEPLVEVWPISHTFGVLIRRGWDFGKYAVDLGTSSNNAKLCYVKFN